jgi:hypothetical protein
MSDGKFQSSEWNLTGTVRHERALDLLLTRLPDNSNRLRFGHAVDFVQDIFFFAIRGQFFEHFARDLDSKLAIRNIDGQLLPRCFDAAHVFRISGP